MTDADITPMAYIYLAMIKDGRRTIDQVPTYQNMRAQVQYLLDKESESKQVSESEVTE